ncbi:hypothetical protein [Pseudomonas zhanjiangensis]|uniref:PXPV repeat-containing protein n=1 Tax=Pseudomonas zhanjiangensis TaxID=3239015 RepID=A0ABV3YXK2_9PSED
MNAYLAPLAIAGLALSTGLAAAESAPGYREPGYLNYDYAPQSSPAQAQQGAGYHEPGYLNYAYAPGSSAAPAIQIYGQSAAAGSAYRNASGQLEPGYQNYGFAPAR